SIRSSGTGAESRPRRSEGREPLQRGVLDLSRHPTDDPGGQWAARSSQGNAMHDNVEKHVTGGTAVARILGRLAAALVVAALAVPACDSTVTESALMKWTNTDLGLARIKEVVADPQQPMDTRVRA